jgi:tetratricopeptide (TPR) repeat protein
MTATGDLPRRRRRVVALAIGIVGVILAVLAWFELHPPALAEADRAYRRDDLSGALGIARRHLSHRPTSRYAALLAARCLSRLGHSGEAETLYRRVWPLDHEDCHIRAYGLVTSNARVPAIQAYEELLERWPDDVLALSRMAAVLISQRDWDRAIVTARRLCEIPAGLVIGHTLAGAVNHDMGEFEAAADDFIRVLELDPHLKQMPLKPRSIFWSKLGHSLLRIGRIEEAQRHLGQGLREGDDPRIADLLGEAYFLQGAFDDAAQYWRLALQWDPRRFGTWWRLGKLELQRGRPGDAVEPLRRSIALQPNAVGPLYSLTLTYRRLGQSEAAAKVAEQADRCRGRALASAGGKVEETVLGLDEEAR